MGKVTKSRGNMYDWVTHLWNPIVGCPHQCQYCYVKRFHEQPPEPRLDEPFPNLGEDRTIFVGHLCDLFADGVSDDWVRLVLAHCGKFKNRYVLQTKNTDRLTNFYESLPSVEDVIIGTTIETDDDELVSRYTAAPPTRWRAAALGRLGRAGYKTFLTIEPIMEFNIDRLLELVWFSRPAFINVGADSKKHELPEPTWGEAWKLVTTLRNLEYDVRVKPNLYRLRLEKTKPLV